MENEVKKFLRVWFTVFGIIFTIQYLWEWVDTIEFGSPQPSIMDTAAGILLTMVIYWYIKEDSK